MNTIPSVSEALCIAETFEESLKHGVSLDFRNLALISLARQVRKDNAEKA
jgi:hypothetical protein